MSTYINFVNPFSSHYHALKDFSELKKADKISIVALTFFSTIISAGLLTVPTFRFLVDRFERGNMRDRQKFSQIRQTYQTVHPHNNSLNRSLRKLYFYKKLRYKRSGGIDEI